jgi:hypothetical protein
MEKSLRKLLDQVREAIRRKHYSIRTEKKPTSLGSNATSRFTTNDTRRRWEAPKHVLSLSKD